jgi:hypothetical protein
MRIGSDKIGSDGFTIIALRCGAPLFGARALQW